MSAPRGRSTSGPAAVLRPSQAGPSARMTRSTRLRSQRLARRWARGGAGRRGRQARAGRSSTGSRRSCAGSPACCAPSPSQPSGRAGARRRRSSRRGCAARPPPRPTCSPPACGSCAPTRPPRSACPASRALSAARMPPLDAARRARRSSAAAERAHGRRCRQPARWRQRAAGGRRCGVARRLDRPRLRWPTCAGGMAHDPTAACSPPTPSSPRSSSLGDLLAEPRPFTDFVHADDLPEVAGALRAAAARRARHPAHGRPRRAARRRDRLGADRRRARPRGRTASRRTSSSSSRTTRTGCGRPRARSREQLARLPGASVTEDWLAPGVRGRHHPGRHLRARPRRLRRARRRPRRRRRRPAPARRGGPPAASRRATTSPPAPAATSSPCSSPIPRTSPPSAASPTACRARSPCRSAIDGLDLVVSASIGVAEGPTAHACPKELLRAADVARSWAKALGGGRRVMFDPRRDAGEAARYALVAGLPTGIANGEFRARLPAAGHAARRPRARRRGARALAAPPGGADRARPVHRARRAERGDRRARPLGARPPPARRPPAGGVSWARTRRSSA